MINDDTTLVLIESKTYVLKNKFHSDNYGIVEYRKNTFEDL